MSLQLILVGVVALGLVGSHWYAYDAGGDNRENAIAADQAKTRELILETATAVRQDVGREVAEKISGIRVVNRTINNEVQREIREKPVYLSADCATPAPGVVLLNAARRGDARGAGPSADAAVPGSADLRREPTAPPR